MKQAETAHETGRAEAHRARLSPYVQPHLARREAGIKHPVHDFLFVYYAFRPAQLLAWSPGAETLPEDKRTLVSTLLRLLRATAARTGNVGCFGLHEWAMVYRSTTQDGAGTRHPQPLRLGGAATDEVVESHRIACSHFDAYRFFTPDARDLNTLRPGAGDRAEFEQPACLHGGMDLYGKVATRLAGLIPSDLIADAFELAWDIRIL
ncbi:MAG: 3-methyladenine DNA glycosylase, partial [Candidatus Limnocylindria bacterium]